MSDLELYDRQAGITGIAQQILGVKEYGPGCRLVSHTRWKPSLDEQERCVTYCVRCNLAERIALAFSAKEETP